MPAVSQALSVRFRHLIDELQFADGVLKKDPAIDGPTLRALRQALDTLRLTAWSVSEVQSAQQSRNAPNTVISFLRNERLRRFRQMVRTFCSDLERDRASWSPTSIQDLQDSVSELRERLVLAGFRRPGQPSSPKE
jgi:hypothetical protein